MLPDDLGDVVFNGVGGIRVVPRLIRRVGGESVSAVTRQRNCRQLGGESGSIRENCGHGGPRRFFERTLIGQLDVVGGVTEHKFVHQGRRGGVRQPRHCAGRWSHELGLNVGYRGVRPESQGRNGIPRVMNVVKRAAQIRCEIMIQAHQFFAPVGRLGEGGVETGINRRRASRRAVGRGNFGQKSGSVHANRRCWDLCSPSR